ncbi:hypothetical protein FOA43_003119 [Brettanomyces nanus]|uniref:5'-3' DNA helicase ZGRF1-like N-terminal domain-containing protein n=1 Tax=Eeniella nana TaxID=13502 RepID=A0A875S7S6_EENNA|nr:uncharacterized protein FOA43_003119 [Brettanomyces nanus]QPG75759.1 hypothetical protein FOA43_003119 [Brettanomyces nanus]
MGTDFTLNEQLKHSEYSEYRILYTFDIYKKAKVWQDGTLRLFKINKKLIVYDDSKVLVYEDFWKLYETFHERQVIKFDDVWITVDATLGVYERDVLGQFLRVNSSCNDVTLNAKRIVQPVKKLNKKQNSLLPLTPAKRKRRVVGLRHSRGDFKSPLLKKTPKTPARKTLHIDRSYETPQISMLTPPISSYSYRRLDLQTPLKKHLPSQQLDLLQVDVYDSDSQENDDLSDFGEDTNATPKNAQKKLFDKLELGNSGNEIATETWGHKEDSSDRAKAVLDLSKRLLGKP